MSIFNYKARFIKQEGNEVFYDFYPEYICFEDVKGEFKINLKNWEFSIPSKTHIDDWDSTFCNERPTGALTYKIRKYFEENGEFPKEVFWIA